LLVVSEALPFTDTQVSGLLQGLVVGIKNVISIRSNQQPQTISHV
jgi:hypothetical protein